VKYFDSIIAVSDLQAPFQHKDALKFLSAVKAKYYINGKTKVINQGDEIDANSLGRWGFNADGYSAGHEHVKAVEFLLEYWELFPEQDICISNHTIRPFKRAIQAGIPRSFMKDFAELLCAPSGVRWADHWFYNSIVFEHGENVSGPTAALNAAKQNLFSTSIGHQHANGGVLYYQSKLKRIFGLNTGCLIDVTAYAFDYGKVNRSKPTLGCGVILGEDAHFIPMELTKAGRWIGKLR
jgi:hypothetical protein